MGPIKLIKGNKGATLVVALIAIMFMSILGVGLLRTSLSETKFVIQQEKIHQAHYTAMSSANSLGTYLVNNPDNKPDIKVFLDNDILSGGNSVATSGLMSEIDPNIDWDGEYETTISKGGDNYTIESVGAFDGVSRSVALEIEELRFFETALFADSNIYIHANTTLTGNGTPFVAGGEFTGNTDALEGEEYYDSTTAPTSADIVAAMERLINSPDYQFPDSNNFEPIAYESIPNGEIDDIFVNENSGENMGIYLGPLDLSNSENLIITNNSNEDMHIMVDSLVTKSNTNFRVKSPNAKTFLYVHGPGGIQVLSEITIEDSPIGNFVIFANEGSGDLELRTGGDIYQALIFAPHSDVYISQGGTSYIGSIIADSIYLEQGGSAYEYPVGFEGLIGEDLGLPSLGFRVKEWKQ